MTTEAWKWRGKDGGGGGLLYESGNWGDLLKMLWLSAILTWKRQFAAPTNYLDTFAGDVAYPLGRKTLFRLEQAGLTAFDFLREPYLASGRWPSSASAARLLTPGRVEVFDADAGRRGNWREVPGVTALEGESGWDILEAREGDPDALWLVDPYDFLAEWRQRLPALIAKAEDTSILLYLYNRSARNDEFFREYRAFKNTLEDLRGDLPKRLGRIPADVFLPRSHHEMLFLPGRADRERDGFKAMLRELGERTAHLTAAHAAAAAFDC